MEDEVLTGDYANVDLLPAGSEDYEYAMEHAVAIGEFGEGAVIEMFWGNDDMGNLPEAFESFTSTLLPDNQLLLEAVAHNKIDEYIFLIFVVMEDIEYQRVYFHVTTDGDEIVFEEADLGPLSLEASQESLGW